MKNSLYLCTQKPMHNAKVRLKKRKYGKDFCFGREQQRDELFI
jgi:hypothetical protein